MASKAVKGRALSAGAIAAIVSILIGFTPIWEGMDKVARRDPVGTGHPVTYCYGQTDEFGAVKVGQRFTKAQCDPLLALSLPKYIVGVAMCVYVVLPAKVWASIVDAAYNAGVAAVCRSPMVRQMNAGNVEAGCRAFYGWYIRGNGNVLPGLIARRAGRPGDYRTSEKQLCLEGLTEPEVE